MDEKQLNSPTPEEKRLLNLINSLEYCSIERAAELFNIKREDVEQFFLSGSITCSLQLSAYVPPMQDPEVLNKLYAFFDELDPDVPPILWGEKTKKYLNEVYGSPVSQVGVTIDHKNPDTIKFSLSGFWHLIPYNKQGLIDNIRNPQNSPLPSLVCAIPSTYFPTQTEQERDRAEPIGIDLSKITHQDIVISKRDLKVLYDALITGKTPLKSIFNDPELAQELEKQQQEMEQENQKQARKPRVDALPSHAFITMLKAAGIDMNGSHKQISKSVDNYLKKADCSPLALSEKTLGNWINKAAERSKDK